MLKQFTARRCAGNLAFDGKQMWLTHFGADIVTSHRDRDGALLKVVNVRDSPEDVLFDGTNIWVSDLFNNTVSKVTPPSSGNPSQR